MPFICQKLFLFGKSEVSFQLLTSLYMKQFYRDTFRLQVIFLRVFTEVFYFTIPIFFCVCFYEFFLLGEFYTYEHTAMAYFEV